MKSHVAITTSTVASEARRSHIQEVRATLIGIFLTEAEMRGQLPHFFVIRSIKMAVVNRK
jgi:hypothetical protein